MYCHSCGIPLGQQLKYCNRCGAQLIKADNSTELRHSQRRLDSYLDGLFWITVIGLAVILGGLIVLKKFGFPEWVWVSYLSLSSTAFLINFGISLWGASKIIRGSKEIQEAPEPETRAVEAASQSQLPPSQPATSITENTTRSFEPIIQKRG